MITVRTARETEAAQIRDLIHLVSINPMGLDWKRFVVAVDDRDEMVGCGQLKPTGKMFWNWPPLRSTLNTGEKAWRASLSSIS